MIGYKTAINPLTNQRALVVLEIPEDGKNNINRTGIYDPIYARYRCDRAKVVSVKDLDTNAEIEGAISMFGHSGQKKILYVKDEIVKSDGYEENPRDSYAAGIHFFLSEEPARHLCLQKPADGIYKDWYDDGRLAQECFFKDGVLHGECVCWFPNGNLEFKGSYDHGLKHGLHQTWFDTGNLKYEYNYKDDHLHGEVIEYYFNGNMRKRANYNMHKLDGDYYEWYHTGKPSCVAHYKNGEKHGEYRSYHGNGVLMEESYFMFGKEHGQLKRYDESANLIFNRCYRNGYICR